MSTNQTETAGSKAKLYWAIGIVCTILVAALLIWNSGILSGNNVNENATAATVGEKEYSAAEVSYYYQAVANQFITQAEQYAMYGIDMGYDTALSPSEQFIDEEAGTTYADYFMESALQELQRVALLTSEAEAAGYTLSEEGQAAINQNMSYLTMYSVQNNYTEDAYLKLLYGEMMTKDLFEKVLADGILADEYSNHVAYEFTYSQDELEAYYAENANALDSYSYRYCTITANVETETDEEGNPIEATEEETAAAMEAASQEADAMIAEILTGGATFNQAAAAHVDESVAASYEDEEYNHNVQVTGDTVTTYLVADAADWVMSAGRSVGDIAAIEVEGTGYTVVQFLGRTKGDDIYQTMSYQTMVIPAEDASNAESLAAAEDQAKALLGDWESGAVTEFGALATESVSPELVENADRDTIASDLSAWLFETGRQVGDVTVLSYTDSTGAVTGYQLVMVEAFGDVRWEAKAADALRSIDYSEWYTEMQA
ncbi:MAG: SurA N-terminal domain-containing protein, partial [Ruminiclostridium sp.]|nr:SurA N-terminal domain-containing protein [Ruminiclostridium sp.]